MRTRQFGFGGLQVMLSVAVIAVVSLLAVPKYNAMMDKAKLTEAFNLAGESRKKLAEFYMLNSRFPRTTSEAEAAQTSTLSTPEYVQFMIIEPNSVNHDIMVKVFLKPGAVKNDSGADQYIYVAGDSNSSGTYAVEWSCGASGIDSELLPENCQG